MGRQWVSVSSIGCCLTVAAFIICTQSEEKEKCGPIPTPFDVVRHPFYAPDLEEIIERVFDRRVKIAGFNRESIQKMYAELKKREGAIEEIHHILEDIRTTWKHEWDEWQSRGCLDE
ncbi:hypothetical protein HOLleu_08146 [Holothuria leucospilota]|uniref:Uncharacterized protein n=1 Tax=Holothuria leucospilota TaxID=206669 RepID=A0A9Q1HG44_HOLLE|nr:hypothetical protein HOLleu_08146 [Holothuria leucospilota]